MHMIAVEPVTGCWLWTRYKSSGYGRLNVGGVPKLAHRVSYELFRGPIQPGLVLDHLCRNRACVNPDHLRAVTLTVNALENSNCPTAINASKTACPKCGRAFDAVRGKGGREHRRCRPCHASAARARWQMRVTVSRQGAHNAAKTHCLKGHEYSPENTYRVRNHRQCKTCNRNKARAYRARLATLAVAA